MVNNVTAEEDNKLRGAKINRGRFAIRMSLNAFSKKNVFMYSPQHPNSRVKCVKFLVFYKRCAVRLVSFTN